MGVSVGLADAVSSGVGVGEFLLCFRFPPGVGLGDGVGETFLCFGVAVGDGAGVAFFADCLRCLRGAGVGVGSKILLIFVPNDSSASPCVTIMPTQIAPRKSTRNAILVAGSNQ